MKIRWTVLLLSAIYLPALLLAQGVPSTAPAPGHRETFEKRVVIRGEMGKWWRDAEISKKLQLSDGQVAQLDQIFFDHRMKLIDYGADMEKQDLKLHSMLDADQPNEGEIGSQVDLVLSARGKLEREYTFMNLDLRRVLSLDQWRTLKSVRGDVGVGDNIIFMKKQLGGPGAGPIHAPFPPDVEIDIQKPDPTM